MSPSPVDVPYFWGVVREDKLKVRCNYNTLDIRSTDRKSVV